ncbi:unnamed protein product [Prunus brigantina]
MFRPLYFSLGFTFLLSNRFFKLELTRSMLKSPKLFHSFSQSDHVWHANVLEVSGRWESKVGDENDIYKRLELGLDMVKVHQALNIPARFRE